MTECSKRLATVAPSTRQASLPLRLVLHTHTSVLFKVIVVKERTIQGTRKRTKDAPLSPNVNDPSAGSPTETLLRLLLPLNEPVWSSSQPDGAVLRQPRWPVQ